MSLLKNVILWMAIGVLPYGILFVDAKPNIAKQHPETHQRLFSAMMEYFVPVGARIPKPNPNYDPEHCQSLKEYRDRAMWGAFEGKRPLEEDDI